jgi:hypothetical protein
MPEVSIDMNDVASVGVVKDTPPHEIPPEAWTLGENIRFSDTSVARLTGETPIFGTPSVPPYGLQFISTTGIPFWLYLGLNKIYVYDGTAHTDITRQSGAVDVNYNATGAADWNTTILGGIPIQNNGIDVPQFWSALNSTTKLANLTNWTSGMTAKVLRAFGPYLMALNVTVGGIQKPHNVRWSHPADPGTIPVTWDITDATHNAGEVTLPDVDSGLIQDGLPLQGKFYVYKENSCWRFRNIGGRFIFDEDAFLETIGLLTTRCVAITGDGQRHVFVSGDNIYTHDGNSAKPLLDKKMRRYLFNQIDVGNYRASFGFCNPVRDEFWFCYPSQGNSQPNRGLIVNYNTGASTETDVDFQAALIGTVQTSDSETWSASIGDWSSDNSPWSVSNRRKIVLAKPTTPSLLQLDLGTQREGSAFTGTLQRTSLGVVGRKRNGEWIEDFEVRKLVTRIWPKMSGGPVNIRMGGQDVPNGAITWGPMVPFNPATQKYCDLVAEGSALSVEISGSVDWQLDGYKLDMVTLGRF